MYRQHRDTRHDCCPDNDPDSHARARQLGAAFVLVGSLVRHDFGLVSSVTMQAVPQTLTGRKKAGCVCSVSGDNFGLM